jgi:hypothetical protein
VRLGRRLLLLLLLGRELTALRPPKAVQRKQARDAAVAPRQRRQPIVTAAPLEVFC